MSNQFAQAAPVELLQSAIARHDLESIKRLILEEKVDPFTYIYDRNALHNASVYGHVPTLQFLLENGSARDIDARTTDFQLTPLMLAAEKGRYDAVRLLLDYGADKSLMSVHKKLALDFARDRKHDRIVELLQSSSSSSSLSDNTTVVNVVNRSSVQQQQQLLQQEEKENQRTLVLQSEIEQLKKRIAVLEQKYEQLLNGKLSTVSKQTETNTNNSASNPEATVDQMLEMLKSSLDKVENRKQAQTQLNRAIITLVQLSQQWTDSL